jgi:matrix metalloproteinase-14 (membrane-inserted)
VDKLTWRITKYPSSGSLSKDEVEAEIKKAFQFWADKTALKFEKKKSGTPHIDIRFEKREHGDGDPFDGVGGTLAHAFFPQYGGDAHFDDQEYWTINSFRGTNILQTAAHEFGHSLGLSHSDVRSALMAPFYKVL